MRSHEAEKPKAYFGGSRLQPWPGSWAGKLGQGDWPRRSEIWTLRSAPVPGPETGNLVKETQRIIKPKTTCSWKGEDSKMQLMITECQSLMTILRWCMHIKIAWGQETILLCRRKMCKLHSKQQRKISSRLRPSGLGLVCHILFLVLMRKDMSETCQHLHCLMRKNTCFSLSRFHCSNNIVFGIPLLCLMAAGRQEIDAKQKLVEEANRKEEQAWRPGQDTPRHEVKP